MQIDLSDRRVYLSVYGFFFLNMRNIPADFFSLPLVPPILDLLPVDCVSFSLELSLFALFIDERESNVNDIGRDIDDDDDSCV